MALPTRLPSSPPRSADGVPVSSSFRILVRGDSQSLSQEEFDPELESRILVLYTGGTIGMKRHEGAYSPEPNYLLPELRQSPLFNDMSYVLPISSSYPVDKPRPRPLVLPHAGPHNKRIIYTLYEYEPLLDSSNMSIDDYVIIAEDIKENYHLYEGFVILHGTDTMAYTASALSFMLEYLGKPVVLTGSQIPIFELRSDGRDNFIGALLMAGSYIIPEVTIYFHNQLLRGNRTMKVDAEAMDAFKSPNMHPLAELEIHIKVHYNAIFRMVPNKPFNVHINLCKDVSVLRLFPSITTDTIESFLRRPMAGVVLQSYGAGNGPDARPDIIKLLAEASQRGMLIVNISQCVRGNVLASYATGQALLKAGVIPGADMTAEAALMKLSYVLGKEEWSHEKKREMLGQNLRGELTLQREGHIELTLIEKLAQTMRLSSDEEVDLLKDAVFPSLMCHATRNKDIKSLEKLQAVGGDVKVGDYDDRTPLHVAVCEGHKEVVEWLADHGAFMHIKDRYGHSPLDDAVRFSRHEIIKDLKARGASLSVPAPKLSLQLSNCVAYEQRDLLQAWYEAGADINTTDHFGKTPLHVAVVLNKMIIAQDLLNYGANPSKPDRYGMTAIDEAKRCGYTQIQELLEGKTTLQTAEIEHVLKTTNLT